MYRKWKRVSAIGMAVLIGCLLPMGTMMAAEENTEAVQETEADLLSDVDVDDDAGDSVVTDADNIGIYDSGVMFEIQEEKPETESAAVAENVDIQTFSYNQPYALTAGAAAPVIDIKWQGQSRSYELGGKINYEYVNNHNQSFECSANLDGQAVTIYYYLEKVTDTNAEAKGSEQMDSLSWASETQSFPVQITLLNDGNYVLYAKAEGADGQAAYARSGGIVVDTEAPKVTGVEAGNAYSEGTAFRVEDANLDSVTVNESPVTPEPDGSYRVIANGTSCVIKAKDKAGNNTTCSVIVFGKNPGTDGNVISGSGLYALKADTEYKLGDGKWQINGDSAVYWGGSAFYVKKDGDYRFTRR